MSREDEARTRANLLILFALMGVEPPTRAPIRLPTSVVPEPYRDPPRGHRGTVFGVIVGRDGHAMIIEAEKRRPLISPITGFVQVVGDRHWRARGPRATALAPPFVGPWLVIHGSGSDDNVTVELGGALTLGAGLALGSPVSAGEHLGVSSGGLVRYTRLEEHGHGWRPVPLNTPTLTPEEEWASLDAGAQQRARAYPVWLDRGWSDLIIDKA